MQKQVGLKPAAPPEKKSAEPSLQFFGDGYLKYKPRSEENVFREISFSFKTKQKNGLLLYSPYKSDYFKNLFVSFEVVDGKLVYQFNNGYDKDKTSIIYKSPNDVNDGKVHSVVKSRTQFILDGKVIASFTRDSQELSSTTIFVGGVPFGEKLAARYGSF